MSWRPDGHAEDSAKQHELWEAKNRANAFLQELQGRKATGEKTVNDLRRLLNADDAFASAKKQRDAAARAHSDASAKHAALETVIGKIETELAEAERNATALESAAATRALDARLGGEAVPVTGADVAEALSRIADLGAQRVQAAARRDEVAAQRKAANDREIAARQDVRLAIRARADFALNQMLYDHADTIARVAVMRAEDTERPSDVAELTFAVDQEAVTAARTAIAKELAE
jgi:hypothetical protein